MRLTREGDYAVRVMVDLAARAGDGPVPRAAIHARQDVPAAYLAKIVQSLARAGLVRTRPGAGGGVSLNVPAETVTLRRVVEAIEGPIALNRCVTARGACPRDVFCPVHPVWLRVQALVTRELDRFTIAALAAPRATACAIETLSRPRVEGSDATPSRPRVEGFEPTLTRPRAEGSEAALNRPRAEGCEPSPSRPCADGHQP